MAGGQYVHGKEDDAKIGNYLNLYPGVLRLLKTCQILVDQQKIYIHRLDEFKGYSKFIKTYHKVKNSNMSCLEAHEGFFQIAYEGEPYIQGV